MAYIGVSPSNGVRRVHTYTATASQTTFSGAGAEGTSLSYKDSNFVDVYQNGVKLGDADYTATSGTSIVLGTGATASDLVVVVVFDVFSVADTVSKADGGTFDGNVTMGGTLDVTGIGTFSDDIVIGDGKTIGSASKTDAITIASSGLVQLTSTGIGAGSQVFQVIDDGATLFQIRSEDGNVSFPQAGAGIFLGVTSGNSANLLDDYEEGTFVPKFAFGGGSSGQSYAKRVGFYTKVGRMVYFTLRLEFSARGSSTGAITIEDLPFTTLSTSDSESGAYVSFVDASSNFDTNNLTLVLDTNGTTIRVRRVNSGTSGEFAASDFGNSSQMIVSGTYMTS